MSVTRSWRTLRLSGCAPADLSLDRKDLVALFQIPAKKLGKTARRWQGSRSWKASGAVMVADRRYAPMHHDGFNTAVA